jgi:hypothetical protein
MRSITARSASRNKTIGLLSWTATASPAPINQFGNGASELCTSVGVLCGQRDKWVDRMPVIMRS